MRKKFFLWLLVLLGLPNYAVATREICGEPPPSQFREENNESIKGDLEGKANFLSGFVGKAELGGKIESTRKEIFAKYADANTANIDRYLAYMFCFVIFDPKNKQDPNDKIKAIQEFRQRQQKPQSSIDKAKDNVALSIHDAAEDLAKRAEEARIFGPDRARDLVDEYNRQLQEAKDSLPKEHPVHLLKQLEYYSHYPSAGKMVAAAARKLARVANQMTVGDLEAVQKVEPAQPVLSTTQPLQRPVTRAGSQEKQNCDTRAEMYRQAFLNRWPDYLTSAGQSDWEARRNDEPAAVKAMHEYRNDRAEWKKIKARCIATMPDWQPPFGLDVEDLAMRNDCNRRATNYGKWFRVLASMSPAQRDTYLTTNGQPKYSGFVAWFGQLKSRCAREVTGWQVPFDKKIIVRARD